MSNRNQYNLDYTFYYNFYDDIKNIQNVTKAKVLLHYQRIGIRENRYPNPKFMLEKLKFYKYIDIYRNNSTPLIKV